MDLITPEKIEELLSFLESEARSRESFAGEWERERTRFLELGAGPGVAISPSAILRFREYFLIEYCSEQYGVSPAFLLLNEPGRDLDDEMRELAEVLFESTVGIYEVTGREPDGTAVGEAYGGGELTSIIDPGFIGGLLEGDFIAGRLYPRSATEVLVSPGAAVIRDSRFTMALRADLDRLRAQSPHLRFSQLEFEGLFFRHQASAPLSLPQARADLAGFLESSGDRELNIELVESLARETQSVGEFIGPLMERLAFETSCDLDAARRTLVDFWNAQASDTGTPPEDTRAVREASPEDRIRAVEAFERGRAEGRELGPLIAELEEALGVAEVDGEGRNEEDFDPGTVGIQPIIAEYSWDRERLGQPVDEPALGLLSAFASSIDGGRHTVDSVDSLTADIVDEFLLVGLPGALVERSPGNGERDTFLADAWNHLDEFFSWLDREQGTGLLARLRETRSLIESDHLRLLEVLETASEPDPRSREEGASTTVWVRVLAAAGGTAIEIEAIGVDVPGPGPQQRVSVECGRQLALREGDLAHVELGIGAGGGDVELLSLRLLYSEGCENLLKRLVFA